MLTTEQQLKSMIIENFNSVRAFALKCNLPYSTLDNIFKRGVLSAGLINVSKLCSGLEIDLEGLANGQIVKKSKGNSADEEKSEPIKDEPEFIISDDEKAFIHNLRQTDEYGKNHINYVLQREVERAILTTKRKDDDTPFYVYL